MQILVTFEEGGVASPSASPAIRQSVAAINMNDIVAKHIAEIKSETPSEEFL